MLRVLLYENTGGVRLAASDLCCLCCLLRGSGEGWVSQLLGRAMPFITQFFESSQFSSETKQQQQQQRVYLSAVTSRNASRKDGRDGHLAKRWRRCFSTDVHSCQHAGHNCGRHLQSIAGDQHNNQRRCLDQPCTGPSHSAQHSRDLYALSAAGS